MKLFTCCGGAAAVADDDEAAAEAAAGSRSRSRCRAGKRGAGRRLPLSFRWRRFFPGKLQGQGKKKKRPPSTSTSPPPGPPPAAEAKKKRGMDMDLGGRRIVFGEFAASSSDSSSDSDSSPSTPARSSTASSSSSPSSPSVVSGLLYPPPVPVKGQASNNKTPAPSSPAAAVALCLLMVVFCGRIGATLLTPTALYLFPRRWRLAGAPGHSDDGAMDLDSLQPDAEEQTTVQRKVALMGQLVLDR